jgi:hypothetical protein
MSDTDLVELRATVKELAAKMHQAEQEYRTVLAADKRKDTPRVKDAAYKHTRAMSAWSNATLAYIRAGGLDR